MVYTPWTKSEINFLEQNYSIIGGKQCSKILNRTYSSIRSKASNLKLKSAIKNIDLYTYDWLYNEYIICKKNSYEIANQIGVSNNTVCYALHKLNIPIRNITEAKLVKQPIIYYNMNVINGSLLGDAHLSITNKKNKQDGLLAIFGKSNINYDHLALVASSFYESYEKRIKFKSIILKGKRCNYWFFSTYSNKYLKSLYNIWYPESNNYKKLVPRNIELNSEVLLHWFMDDGTSYKKDNTAYIKFCTDAFSKEDQDWLCNEIYKTTNIPCSAHKHNKDVYRIRISRKYVNSFLEVIGPCPVKSLEYKWKYV